jgi:hypothetical protein
MIKKRYYPKKCVNSKSIIFAKRIKITKKIKQWNLHTLGDSIQIIFAQHKHKHLQIYYSILVLFETDFFVFEF